MEAQVASTSFVEGRKAKELENNHRTPLTFSFIQSLLETRDGLVVLVEVWV